MNYKGLLGLAACVLQGASLPAQELPLMGNRTIERVENSFVVRDVFEDGRKYTSVSSPDSYIVRLGDVERAFDSDIAQTVFATKSGLYDLAVQLDQFSKVESAINQTKDALDSVSFDWVDSLTNRMATQDLTQYILRPEEVRNMSEESRRELQDIYRGIINRIDNRD